MTREQYKKERKDRRLKHFIQAIRSGIPLVICIIIFLLIFTWVILAHPKTASESIPEMEVQWEVAPAEEPIKIVRHLKNPEIQPAMDVKFEPEIAEVTIEIIPDLEPVEERIFLGTYWVTGYDICEECCGNTDGITASGEYATVGRTVTASYDLPFGTILYIEGIGERVVEDRGGAVYSDHIDVLCANHEECYAITGYYDVYIIKEV